MCGIIGIASNKLVSTNIIQSLKKFEYRLQNIDWQKYHSNFPFKESSLALYEFSPIADELKILDKKNITGVVALLVHAAKIDEQYSDGEKVLIKEFISSYLK